jgi:hypothetical protein
MIRATAGLLRPITADTGPAPTSKSAPVRPDAMASSCKLRRKKLEPFMGPSSRKSMLRAS